MALVIRLGRWEFFLGVKRGWPWPFDAGRGLAGDGVLGFGAWVEVY